MGGLTIKLKTHIKQKSFPASNNNTKVNDLFNVGSDIENLLNN